MYPGARWEQQDNPGFQEFTFLNREERPERLLDENHTEERKGN